MKQIIIIIALFALLQNVGALNTFPVRENQNDASVSEIRYPVLRCGFVDRPGVIEPESGLINEGALERPKIPRTDNPSSRNPFSTGRSFRCRIVWETKELPVSER